MPTPTGAPPRDEHQGLDDSLTPTGAAGLFVALSRLVELQRTLTPAIRGAVEAQTARDRSRAAAWDAVTQVARSKWSIPAATILAAALALAGLEVVGVDLTALPEILTAARQCPVCP
jgi:hypothetical protein